MGAGFLRGCSCTVLCSLWSSENFFLLAAGYQSWFLGLCTHLMGWPVLYSAFIECSLSCFTWVGADLLRISACLKALSRNKFIHTVASNSSKILKVIYNIVIIYWICKLGAFGRAEVCSGLAPTCAGGRGSIWWAHCVGLAGLSGVCMDSGNRIGVSRLVGTFGVL